MKKRDFQQHSEEYKAKICIEEIICFLATTDKNTKELFMIDFQMYLDGKIVNRDEKQKDTNRGYVSGSYDRKHPTIYDIIAENESHPL